MQASGASRVAGTYKVKGSYSHCCIEVLVTGPRRSLVLTSPASFSLKLRMERSREVAYRFG